MRRKGGCINHAQTSEYCNRHPAAVLSTQNQQALLFLFLFLCARPFSTESIWLHLICLDHRPIQG